MSRLHATDFRRALIGGLLALAASALPGRAEDAGDARNGMLTGLTYAFLFPRDMAPPADSAGRALPPGASRLTLPLDGGRDASARGAEAWLLPAPRATAARPAPLVIYFHGNAEIIDGQPAKGVVALYRRLGFSVLLPEYRGYGRSPGEPTQEGIREDAAAFYDEAIRRPEIDPSRIVFHGQSVGGAIAVDLAAHRPPAALVLVSTFAGVRDMAAAIHVPPILVPDLYPTVRTLPTLAVPRLLFHGWRDEVVPVAQGRALRDAAPEARYVEYGCGHNDFPGEGNEGLYLACVERFLRECGVVTMGR